MKNLPLTFILIILFCGATFAQNNTYLHLKLIDQNAGLIEKASAVLRDEKGVQKSETIQSTIGLVEFNSLPAGNYTLEILSQGFKRVTRSITIKNGKNVLEITLEIEQISEAVSIDLSPREKRFADAANKFFSEDELKKLPDNPEEIKKELQRRYGDEVVMRINGFTGGQFPDKSQIA